MKILFVTGIFPPDIGGPATYVPLMAGALAVRGHKVSVLTTSEPQEMDHDDSRFPFPVVRINRRLPLWRRTFALIRLIIRHGREADVLYANGMHLETALANKFLRKPLVMKIVGDEAWERATRKGWTRATFEEFQQKRQPWPAEFNKWLRSWATRQADKVIVPSQYLKRCVVGWYVPEGRIVVIYNALEPLNGIQATEVPLQSPIKVVTVGRLVPWKHIDQVMEAVARLESVGLVIIGDGPERRHLEEMARVLGIVDRIYFAGQRSKAETLSFMAACDIFVLNSTYEGFPHVVLEAMSLGLPVVTTAVGGTPEIVRDGETGILIQPGDTEALYETLKKLIRSAGISHGLKERAQAMVKGFSLSNMVTDTESVLWRCSQELMIHANPRRSRN